MAFATNQINLLWSASSNALSYVVYQGGNKIASTGATGYGDVGLTAISSKEAFAKAREAARQALAIDDMLAEAHNSLAHVCMHDFNWPEAAQAFRRAIELSPNNSTAHQWYAFYLLFHQQNEAAIREAARGLELDPLSLAANGDWIRIAARSDGTRANTKM